MDLDAEVAVLEKSRRTLTRWGIWGTALYLGALLGYGVFAGRDFTKLTPNEVGDFLAGAFAPLAFLWLVLGYRMQALELEQNSKALRQQAEEMRNAVEQAEKQAFAAKKSADASVIKSAFDLRNFIRGKCSIIISELFKVTGFEATKDTSWEKFNNGDDDIFFREFNDLYENSVDFKYALQDELEVYTVQSRVDKILSLMDIYEEFIGGTSLEKMLLNEFRSGSAGAVRDQLDAFTSEFAHLF